MAKDIEKKEELQEEEGAALVNAADNVDVALAKSEEFIEKNQKTLLFALLAIVVVAIGAIMYVKNVRNPRIEEANLEIAKPQQYFMMDSFQIALDGKDGDAGFLSIIEDYSGTPAEDLAQAYAGICYKKLGDNEKAVEYLEKFDESDKVVTPAIYGAIGDCYLDMNVLDKAKKYYEKAISSKNTLIAPIYMERLALVLADGGDNAKAISIWKDIKSTYPKSEQAKDADKMIGYLEAK